MQAESHKNDGRQFWVSSGLNVEPIITHRFELDDFQQAFDLMESGQSGKIILDWG